MSLTLSNKPLFVHNIYLGLNELQLCKVSVTKANPLKTSLLAGVSLHNQNPLQQWDQSDIFINVSVMVPRNVSLRKPSPEFTYIIFSHR